jgi:hypothetical protein
MKELRKIRQNPHYLTESYLYKNKTLWPTILPYEKTPDF